MYRDNIIDDEDWDGGEHEEEITLREVMKTSTCIFVFMVVVLAVCSPTGQSILHACLGQGDFLLAIVPGLWTGGI